MDKSDIYSLVESAIKEVSPYAAEFLKNKEKDVVKDTYLIDLGINSIDYAEVVSMVMGNLEIQHSLDIFTRTNRINDVIHILHNLSSERAAVA
ncbi:phosphopantetheine-binding protein [Teredinibacter sp. KSP-S5-2]|uniref:phosphopantetheine-binding protein n=1 Tax=Teredinibacter sp. KSP-S5-2 TaxID=3034506 RepID=UPI00293505E7|nr:phosphopantetheine-binding protein [Teredinibacter sp. KSP-S5-2]WNO11146.1 phosphopantetheine-binding protein [Teredinibacter sp. KSP-S5-2]